MVHVPGSAEVVLALDDRDALHTLPFELNGRTNAAEARADDDGVVRRLRDSTPSRPVAITSLSVTIPRFLNGTVWLDRPKSPDPTLPPSRKQPYVFRFRRVPHRLLDGVTIATIVAAGVLLAWAMLLGVWKYQQVMASPDGQAHVYVDIAHRAALMYSFATLVLAALAALSAWPSWVNAISVAVPLIFFVGAIGSYILHGALRDTENQFSPDRAG